MSLLSKFTFWKNKQATSHDEVEVMEATNNQSTMASMGKLISYSALLIFVVFYLIGIYWSTEPDIFNVNDNRAYQSNGADKQLIIGYTTVLTTERIARKLLDKPGGYLSNDILPPSVFLDNIPAWEFGVLVQVRDMASALRNHMSRSQSQSAENAELKEAEPLFNNDHSLWIWPAAENKYDKAISKLAAYREKLAEVNNPDNQFYTRADNLRAWLTLVEKRLGGLSQRLSASVGQERINTDLSGDAEASQSSENSNNLSVKTAWFQIDDTFH